MSTTIVILAAGRSTRMHSSIPKVMHLLAERPALGYVLDSAMEIKHKEIILVTAPDMEQIRSYASAECPEIIHVIQDEALGTANAVKYALPHIDDKGNTIILYGDVPFVSVETLKKLNKSDSDVAVAAFYTDNPNQYGRVITFNNDLIDIVEFIDANDEQKILNYCNSGIYSINNAHIHHLIHLIKNKNAKKEYYLTDIVQLAIQRDLVCTSLDIDEKEVLAFNTREELSILEEIVQQKIKSSLMKEGVTILLPQTSYIAHNFKAGKDVTIYPNVYIGKDVTVGDNVHIRSFSHIEGASIDNDVSIGPFARIRPNTEIAKKSKIGNFVEVKNSKIKENTKINHLSYIGDSEVGSETNIGAGTITCNFDGISKKSKTIIGNNVSIGSNSCLVAPIKIDDGAFIAAGSVVTKNADKDDLVFARIKQTNLAQGAIKLRNKE